MSEHILRQVSSLKDAGRAVIKPIVKAEAEPSWHLTCSDTAFECISELVVYAVVVIVVYRAVLTLFWRARRRNYLSMKSVMRRFDSDDQLHALRETDMEEGPDLDFEDLDTPMATPRSSTSDLEKAGLERIEPRRRDGKGHKRKNSDGCANASTAGSSSGGGFQILMDDYAPPLEALGDYATAGLNTAATWVKEVVPEMAKEMGDVKYAVHMAAASLEAAVHTKPAAGSPRRAVAASISPVSSPNHSLGPSLVDEEMQEHVSAAPRSALYRVSEAWGATCGGGASEESQLGGGGDALRVDQLLEAFGGAVSICELFGTLMAPAVKNDQGNIAKMRSAWEAMGRPETARALLTTEIGTKVHKIGTSSTTLKDPSAAIALVWLRRSFAFQGALLGGLARNRDQASLSAVASDAYKAHLEPHHNWVLRGTFKMGLGAMPTKEEFLRRLSEEIPLDETERDAVVYADMAELATRQNKCLGRIATLLVELKLDPLIKDASSKRD